MARFVSCAVLLLLTVLTTEARVCQKAAIPPLEESAR